MGLTIEEISELKGALENEHREFLLLEDKFKEAETQRRAFVYQSEEAQELFDQHFGEEYLEIINTHSELEERHRALNMLSVQAEDVEAARGQIRDLLQDIIALRNKFYNSHLGPRFAQFLHRNAWLGIVTQQTVEDRYQEISTLMNIVFENIQQQQERVAETEGELHEALTDELGGIFQTLESLRGEVQQTIDSAIITDDLQQAMKILTDVEDGAFKELHTASIGIAGKIDDIIQSLMTQAYEQGLAVYRNIVRNTTEEPDADTQSVIDQAERLRMWLDEVRHPSDYSDLLDHEQYLKIQDINGKLELLLEEIVHQDEDTKKEALEDEDTQLEE